MTLDLTLSVRLKLPDDADPEVVRRELDDFLAEVELYPEMLEAVGADQDGSPFDGFDVQLPEAMTGSVPRWACSEVGKTCPDSGACHHGCTERCWRVSRALPLSITGWVDWPDEVKAAHAAPTPLQALRSDDGWLAMLLALLVRCESYLQAIPMIGPKGRHEGREELLGLIVPTITRAEELVDGRTESDPGLKQALANVVASLDLPTTPTED